MSSSDLFCFDVDDADAGVDPRDCIIVYLGMLLVWFLIDSEVCFVVLESKENLIDTSHGLQIWNNLGSYANSVSEILLSSGGDYC